MSLSEHNGWGQRLLLALEQNIDPKRLARGRQYIITHRVPDWTLEGRQIRFSGKNKGTAYYGMNEPIRFEGSISLAGLPDAVWDEVIRQMGERAEFVVRLLLNEIPDSIEEPLQALGHSLLPGRYGEDLIAQCNCPETDPPCRHIAAVLCALASRLDQNPLILFEARGLSRMDLVRRLETTSLGGILATALTEEPAPLISASGYFTRPVPLMMEEQAMNPREFWHAARKLPHCPDPPQPSPVPGLLVKKGGDYPAFWQKDSSFIEVMDLFYEEVRKKAKDWS